MPGAAAVRKKDISFMRQFRDIFIFSTVCLGNHRMKTVCSYEKGTVIHLSACDVRIDYLDKAPDTPKAAGILIESGCRII